MSKLIGKKRFKHIAKVLISEYIFLKEAQKSVQKKERERE